MLSWCEGCCGGLRDVVGVGGNFVREVVGV